MVKQVAIAVAGSFIVCMFEVRVSPYSAKRLLMMMMMTPDLTLPPLQFPSFPPPPPPRCYFS